MPDISNLLFAGLQGVYGLMDHLHWQSLLAKLSATATRNSHYCTCLGHLGQYHGQGKYIQCNIAIAIVRDITLNIVNVNSALNLNLYKLV